VFLKADAGTRTPDPFITSEVLYQLSYVGATLMLAAQASGRSPRSAPAPGRRPRAPEPRSDLGTRASLARPRGGCAYRRADVLDLDQLPHARRTPSQDLLEHAVRRHRVRREALGALQPPGPLCRFTSRNNSQPFDYRQPVTK
jgi:hypothetical protein